MYRQAITRRPAPSIIHGLTSALDLEQPDYINALIQHDNYINALRNCGVEVTILPKDERFPDACFVEDPVLLTEKIAIFTSPGAPTRQGEVVLIEPTIFSFYKERTTQIEAPGTLEAGDVLRVDNHFYIGLSKRTNAEGAKQLASILTQYGYSSSTIELKNFLHLKTGVSYLGNQVLLVAGELINHPEFEGFKQIAIDDKDIHTANSIRVNNTVIMPKCPSYYVNLVQNLGLDVVTVDVSEFQKIDGGLSCLSLRF